MEESEKPDDILEALFGESQNIAESSYRRSETPYDPSMADGFASTPIVRNPPRGRPSFPPKKVSAGVFSSTSSSSTSPKKVQPGIFTSTMASGHLNGSAISNGERLQPQIERPARVIEEETSYDDDDDQVIDNNVIGGDNSSKEPSPAASLTVDALRLSTVISLAEPSSKVKAPISGKQSRNMEALRPSPSIFGGAAVPSRARKTPIIAVDDSDDDCMIIDVQSASQEARHRWDFAKKRKPSNARIDKDIVVKKEKSDDAPTFRSSLEHSGVVNACQNSGDSNAASHPRQNPGAPTPPATQMSMQSQSLEPTQPNAQSQSFGTQPILPTPHSSQPRSRGVQPRPDVKSIIATQQAMAKKALSRNNGVFARQNARPSEAESSATGAARKPRNSRQPPTVVPAVCQQESQDPNSWMHEVDDDPDQVHNERQDLRDRLLVLEKEDKLTNEQKLILHKLNKILVTRKRMEEAAKTAEKPEPEDDDSLFVPPQRDPPRRPRPSLGDENGNDNTMRAMLAEQFGNGKGSGGLNVPPNAGSSKYGLTKTGKPRKRALGTTKRAVTAREYFDQQENIREKERSKAQKKKGRQAAAPKTARARPSAKEAKGKGKGKGKAKASKSKSKKKAVVTSGRSLLGIYGDGNDPTGHLMLTDLANNDPISDRLGAAFDEERLEPTIQGSHRKETQFQALFANIPENPYATSSATADRKKLREASKSFGYAKCKAQDGKWLIKGMKSTLYHHQLLGAQWMLQRELSAQAPNGGLLADSMGLGKTVQTLACMVANPPGAEDRERGINATLIVVPAAVLNQWWEEIELHCDRKTFPKVVRYRSNSPISRAVLEDLDIVLTTYHEIMKEFPFPDQDAKEEIARLGYQRWWKRVQQNIGPLHQISWYRVVLDEAQAIKNNSSRTSLACQNLKSLYRWCLSGTPLLNRLEELFPYLRFLKANYSMDWQTFQKYFCDQNAEESYTRISTLLSYTMMRRTMKTTILNRPIITLPQPHPSIEHVSFSPEETIIYRITENRFRDNLNVYFAKGEARRVYGLFMVQLLRLRQCTSHPFMLEKTIRESWTLEDVEELKTKLAKLGRNPKPFYAQCRIWSEDIVKKRNAVKDENDDKALDEYTETADELMPFGQSNYGHKFSMDMALKTLSEKDLYQRVTCGICSDVPTNPCKADCGHMFCRNCIEDYTNMRVSEGQESDILTCPTCQHIINSIKPVDAANLPHTVYNPFDDEDASGSGSRNCRGSQEKRIHDNKKGKDAMGTEPYTAETWLTRSDIDDSFPLTPSAKTAALKTVLLKGFKDAPLDKVVIYVQFRTLARIVGRICKGEGWGFLYLTGDSSLDHRSRAIKMFRDDDNVKILIAGLKCGGLGLNFPWANRCISLDLWWNHAVEQQAFGRIFRIGQTKETYMTRIVVKNSVDQRMLSMQLQKLQSLERAIRDGPDDEDRATLSVKQLANLFGFLRTGEDGEILSIEADYQNDDGSFDASSSSAGPSRAPRRRNKGKGKARARGSDDESDENENENESESDEAEAEQMLEEYENGEDGERGLYGADGGFEPYTGLEDVEVQDDETMDQD